MDENVDKYASEIDNLFDSFIAVGYKKEGGKIVGATAKADRKLSFAARSAGKMKFDEGYDSTSVLVAFRLGWDKETKGYVLTQNNLDRMVAVLNEYGYDVIAPPEE